MSFGVQLRTRQTFSMMRRDILSTEPAAMRLAILYVIPFLTSMVAGLRMPRALNICLKL